MFKPGDLVVFVGGQRIGLETGMTGVVAVSTGVGESESVSVRFDEEPHDRDWLLALYFRKLPKVPR